METRIESDWQGVVNGTSHMGRRPVKSGACLQVDRQVTRRVLAQREASIIYLRKIVDLMTIRMKEDGGNGGEVNESGRARGVAKRWRLGWAPRGRFRFRSRAGLQRAPFYRRRRGNHAPIVAPATTATILRHTATSLA